jgi:hypothetical protein
LTVTGWALCVAIANAGDALATTATIAKRNENACLRMKISP